MRGIFGRERRLLASMTKEEMAIWAGLELIVLAALLAVILRETSFTVFGVS